MVQLTVIDRQFLQKQGDARSIRTLNIPAYRGTIVDRLSHPLAISSPVDSVWMNPQTFSPTDEQLTQLSLLLSEDAESIHNLAERNSAREFVYLKRQLAPNLANKIKNIGIVGLYLQPEYRRFYPDGEVTAHVIGFTNIDEQGQEGLELAYDKWLTGSAGHQVVKQDRMGHVVKILENDKPAESGHDLALSLDHRIQYLAYRELKKAIEDHHATAGSLVVLDVKTGEILAMVNQPSYNPNHNRTKTNDGRYRNRAMTDTFEPGSTMKGLSAANILQNGDYTPDSIVNTAPGWMSLDGHIVKDEHNNGKISLTEVLKHSSNMGITKFTLGLEPNSLWETLSAFGFGERVLQDFPGEASGLLEPHTPWSSFTLATLSFGYGMSVTTLQLAQAYGILASKGIKRPITLLKKETPRVGERVISAKTAEQVIEMLDKVINEDGSGKRARVAGYRAFGKTGTVRMVGPKGYEKNHHIALFVGGAPVDDPRLVVAVVVTDPKVGSYYGSRVAAPVFSKVMGGSLRALGVPSTGGGHHA